MYMCTYGCMCVYIYIYIYIYTYVHMYKLHMYVYTHPYIHIYVYMSVDLLIEPRVLLIELLLQALEVLANYCKLLTTIHNIVC